MGSSFDNSTGFRYNPNSNTMVDEGDADSGDDSEFSGILEIYVHNARNIHNICIYENQDVYAKFSLTYNPDETLSTQIINGGGKNPDFNEKLIMKVTQIDSVLKCEIWMFSRVRNYMEDQLLGFALVPISQVISCKGKITQDYNLSSTDLFHSPAGTVKLSLSLNTSSINPEAIGTNSSISSEVILLRSEAVVINPIEYSNIEFPDINVVQENQQMVSEYFDDPNSRPLASFLHLGASSSPDDFEMVSGSVSPNSGFLSSTTTSLSDGDEKKNRGDGESSSSPTSKGGNNDKDDPSGFSASMINVEEAEQSAMQKQIVDMYMKSMQQFTESLAKMKLPMDLDQKKLECEDHGGGGCGSGDVIQRRENKLEIENNKKKKDGSRVFYGSRAFF